MAALRGGAVPATVGAGVAGAAAGTTPRGLAGGGGLREPPFPAGSPLQCFSLEEDDLNFTSLDAETILEAEEILGTMQSYFDSSVISIIEDFSLSEQSKACLDAQNELSLLTAITEILDSTDDETLSPFDTIMDMELLTSPRERENPSFQKFLSLSRPSLECESPALEPPKSLRPLSSSSVSVIGKADTDLAWDGAAHSLEDLALPKKQVCSTPRVERKLGRHWAREQPMPQRSDGEEEEEETALSLELDSMEAGEFCMTRVGAGAMLEDHEDPCIINTGDVSLSELVKSMHPYCLPTFTVCLDPESEPVAKELLNGPVLLEIVPGEGDSVEIPVVLQPLPPNLPDMESQFLGAEEGTGESVPVDQEEMPGAPSRENGVEEEKKEKPPGKEPFSSTPESKSQPDTAVPGAWSPDSSSQHSTEAPVSGKRQGPEKGRGCERARKSRKKKAEEDQRNQAKPGGDCVAHCLRSASSGQPPEQPFASQQRAAHPSVQVSDFLAQQLERARKEGKVKVHAEQAAKPQGRPRSMVGASLPEKVQQEPQKEPVPESVSVALEKAETTVPVEKTASNVEEQAAVADPGPADPAEGEGDAQITSRQDSGVLESASSLPEQDLGLEPLQSLPAAESSKSLPKEAKPKALSLREYRIRMLHRQPSQGSRKDGEKQAASKWPSIPEPPTELAEIPCLVSPMHPATEAAGAQKSPEKPDSPAAVPFPAGKVPAAQASVPAPATAVPPATAPPPPSTPMPFVTPNTAPTGMPPTSTGAYALYPPVPSWPCFSPQPLGCHGLPPPPTTAPPSTFHMVPALPPPAMAWPPPAMPPPPPFGPGGAYAPVGWAPPPYWPGIPVPPPVPPLGYGDTGAGLQGTAAFPAGGHTSTALLHGQPPAALALVCPELSAFHSQPPASEVGAAGGLARPVSSRVSDPRRQAQLARESSLPKALPGPAQPLATPSAVAALPSRVPPEMPAQQMATLQVAPTQPPEDTPAVASTLLPQAPPAAMNCLGEVSPATGMAGDSPGTHPMEEAAGLDKEAVEKALPEPKAALRQELPGQKSISQAAAPPSKWGRESCLSTKAPAAQPWRHQPLLSPAQPNDNSKDIVQAFISEIGIEATDLSSLLEQFEKSEGKKEEVSVQPPMERRPVGNSGPETQQDRKPLDSLQASELANVAGLTPPATPPHQLWKPLPAVSLLAKTKSPGSVPQEGPQKTAKLMKAKLLPPSKLQGKSPAPVGSAPIHVCSGDHDYCIPDTARSESSSSPGMQPPTKGGSRWNVKHHRDITIKPISSLTKRTLDQPEPTPPVPTITVGPSQESLGMACQDPLDYRTSVPDKATAGCSSPPTSVLLSPAASPCRDQEVRTPSSQPSSATVKRSLRCYRRPRDSPSPSASSWRAGQSCASRSFSSSSDGASESSSSSSSSSSSRSRSRSFSPPPKRWRRYRSRCSHSSSSRSSCGSYGRSRDRSSSSSSTSSYSSRSTSRSQSRSHSPSPRRRSNRRRRYSYDAQDHYQRQRILQKERAIEERRVVFIGKIPSRMTRSELRHRFSVFGDIEECTLHFRSEGDNYGFVTYRYAEEAFAAIESGQKLRRPDEQPFDLCFGGRRQFCRRNYADLDSNREDFDPTPVKSKFDSLDFDTLLRQAQRSLRR